MNTAETPTQVPFDSLVVGTQFRILTGKGYLGLLYVKTGADSYGNRRDEPVWKAQDQKFPCVVNHEKPFER